jgi:alpha-tubulin suppressor-like RCC1 family protein
MWLPKRLGVPGNLKAIEVACGKYHSMCICKEGEMSEETKLFSWGLNEHGQLGLGDKITVQSPAEVISLILKRPIAVSCGEHHSFVLTQDGLYAMGSNR